MPAASLVPDTPATGLSVGQYLIRRLQDYGVRDVFGTSGDPDELMARIRAVLRRSEATARQETETLEAGPVRLSLAARKAELDGKLLDLTEMEFDLLEMLVRCAGRIVSREEITAAIFAREATPYDRFLDVHISHLRAKLAHRRKLIRTVRGAGYVFTAEA